MMSTTAERALRFAFDSGLSRTLEALKKQHEASRTYFSDMFRMDMHYASLGPEVRDSFRLDIMEKQRTGSVALTLTNESQSEEATSKMHGKRKRRDSRLSQSSESLDAPINTELDDEDDTESGARENNHKSNTCKRLHIQKASPSRPATVRSASAGC
ncbi:hypothetical protein BGZ51_005175 [Haplosporangium sp. Z 767]|nr:hypothetical protein BGZ51_005175 [Haplosporangium sp. Z 767]